MTGSGRNPRPCQPLSRPAATDNWGKGPRQPDVFKQAGGLKPTRRISDHLRKNPSLKPKIPEAYEEAYSYAIAGAARETGISEEQFPTQCPWPYEQAMDAGFWPGTGEMGQGSQ